jgi:hypothetical protein
MPVIPATWKAEIGKIAIGGQPKQKASMTESQQQKFPKTWALWHASVMCKWEELSPGPHKARKVGVVRHLSSKYKALSTNPSTILKNDI